MSEHYFVFRLGLALILGALIGAERQWRQRMAGLRTNALVAAGAAMFLMMGGLIAGDGSQGRVAAYVVSGIGRLAHSRGSLAGESLAVLRRGEGTHLFRNFPLAMMVRRRRMNCRRGG